MKRFGFLVAVMLTLLVGCSFASAEIPALTCEKKGQTVTLTDCKLKDNVLILKLLYTNTTDTADSFLWTWTVKVFQGGIECDTTYVYEDNTTVQIKDGASIECEKGFKLRNTTSDVEISIEPFISFSSKDTRTAKIAMVDILQTSETPTPKPTESIFSLRNGITWGMPMEDVLASIRAEAGAEAYDIQEMNDAIPFEGMSAYSVSGLSFGNENSTVAMSLIGAEKYGLFDIQYKVKVGENKPEEVHDEYLRLVRQLEKRYGDFSVSFDHWEKYKSVKQNEYVVSAAKRLKDNTLILIWMSHASNEKGSYLIGMEYQHPKQAEYTQSFMDGSYYDSPDPVFGL